MTDQAADTSPCCNATLEFDPNVVGKTVGDLWLKGWSRCTKCGKHWMDDENRGVVCDAPTWTMTKGGRSVEIGTGRIRFGVLKVDTSERLDVPGLMERISRLPDLERIEAAARALVTTRWASTSSDERKACEAVLREALASVRMIDRGAET